MNDIGITLPIASDLSQIRTSAARRGATWLRATIAGLGAAFAAYGRAASMAHVTAFQTLAKGKAPDPDDLPDGRNPNW